MKTKRSLTGLAAAVLVVTLGVPLSANADPATFQVADIHTLPDGVGVTGGAATLTRTADAVTATVSARGLDKKSAYTMWWVVWNDPGECATFPCTADDLFITRNTVFYATGFVTGNDGSANVTVHLQSGTPSANTQVLFPPPPAEGGLEAGNGFGAEMHLIIRSHGKTLDGMVSTQIGSVGGGCGINVCSDQQGVAFTPP
jgi:hypothetical protein